MIVVGDIKKDFKPPPHYIVHNNTRYKHRQIVYLYTDIHIMYAY